MAERAIIVITRLCRAFHPRPRASVSFGHFNTRCTWHSDCTSGSCGMNRDVRPISGRFKNLT